MFPRKQLFICVLSPDFPSVSSFRGEFVTNGIIEEENMAVSELVATAMTVAKGVAIAVALAPGWDIAFISGQVVNR